MTAPMITKTMQLVGKGLLIFLGGTLSLAPVFGHCQPYVSCWPK